MRTIIATTHNKPEMLKIHNKPKPHSNNQITTIHIASTNVNFSDLLTISNRYPNPQPPFVPNIKITGHKTNNGHPMLALIPSNKYTKLVHTDHQLLFNTNNLDLTQTSGYALITLATYFGLVHTAHLRKNKTVLVLATTKKLNSTAVQITQALSTKHVLTVTSTPTKHELALTHNADTAYNYKKPLPTADLIINNIKNNAFTTTYHAAHPLGRVLLINTNSNITPIFPNFQKLHKRTMALIPFSFKTLHERTPKLVAHKTPHGLNLMHHNKVHPLITAPEPLEATSAVLQQLNKQTNTNKLLLAP